MTPDPYRLEGPVVVQFSGGRSSAYMVWRIRQAFGGTWPEHIPCLFQNTGREMEGTLRFVRDVGYHFEVPVRWLEYRYDGKGTKPYVEEVTFETASRNGEPFEMMLREKRMLPNPVMRFCTSELKIKTAARWVRSVLGWEHWATAVGLRADEAHRVERGMARGASGKDRHHPVAPMHAAGTTLADVTRFWRESNFDLELRGKFEGNCDGCFLKSRAALSRMFFHHPERMAWWPHAKSLFASTVRTRDAGTCLFRANREPYAEMQRVTRDQGVLPIDETFVEGGELCAGGCGA